MKAKRIAACALALTMSIGTVASFTGCGSSNDSSSSKAAGTTKAEDESAIDKTGEYTKVDGKGAKIVVYTNRTDRVDDGSLAKRTEAFEKDNNCTVEYQALKDYSGDIKKKLSSGDYGDVLMIPDDVQLDDLKNYFEPLGSYDDLSKEYKWTNKKMDSSKTVYGLPYGGNAVGILYNKKVWSDAGITETPKTPDEFIEDLKKIKEKNGDAVIPYYTNYKDDWAITQWDSLVLSASGDAEYKTNLLKNKTDLFDKDGGYYKTYKFLYDLYSQKDLLEEDHTTTDWENSKVVFDKGGIGAMVMGSWAIGQFQDVAAKNNLNPDDIGYMPVPITAADGKQYSQTSGDMCLGVSKNSKNKELAKAYIEWFLKASGFASSEGMIPTVVGSELPDNLSEFNGVELFEEAETPDEYIGVFDNIDKKVSKIDLSGNASDNFKFKLAEAAFAGESEDSMQKVFDDLNKKWADARDSVVK